MAIRPIFTVAIPGILALSATYAGCSRGPVATPEADTDTDTDSDTDSDTDADTDSDTDADTDTDTNTGNCGVPNELGPWMESASVTHPLFGLPTTTTPYTNDAGLQALWDQDPGSGNSLDLSANPVQITGAIVTAKGFGDTNPSIWVADASGGMQIFGGNVTGLEAVALGDAVDMEVTEIDNYFGRLQISAVTATPTVSSSGNDVYYGDGTTLADLDFSVPAQRGQNFEFYGSITESSDQCAPDPADPSFICWDVNDGTTTHSIRINSNFAGGNLVDGDCLHFIAPVEYLWDDSRFSADQFGWIRFY